jgi:hypothetical protein
MCSNRPSGLLARLGQGELPLLAINKCQHIGDRCWSELSRGRCAIESAQPVPD